jgi:hypothetical protein
MVHMGVGQNRAVRRQAWSDGNGAWARSRSLALTVWPDGPWPGRCTVATTVALGVLHPSPLKKFRLEITKGG